MSHHFQAGEGALWAQIDGPNSQPVYLGCHQLGDVDEPQGDIELIYCPDPSGPNRFRVVGSTQGAAGAITTTVTTDVADELDWLERARCPFTLFVHMVDAGRKDVFTNYRRSFVLRNARITNRGLSNLAARTPDDNGRSEQSFDLSGEEMLRVVDLAINTQSISEASSITDITFCNDERCRTDDSPSQAVCETGYASTKAWAASPGSTANVLKTTNGATWTATAADPFSPNEDISAVECFELGRDEVRVIVARGTTNAGNPAEIAYTDDGGTTWNTVNVGITNGEFIPTAMSLFALDRNNIWVGSNLGRIYYSADAGLTWSTIEDQVIHSLAWNAVKFMDENVGWAAGVSNVIAKTIDGGASWSIVTGPSAQAAEDVLALEALDRNRAWIGYGNGKLYFTKDGGTTWTERAFSGSGVGEIRDVVFLNDQFGYIAHDNASPVGRVLQTIDGGYSWQAITTPTNVGLNKVWICDLWSFFVVGNAVSGVGYIAKGAL